MPTPGPTQLFIHTYTHIPKHVTKLYLTDGLIPATRCARTRTANAETKHKFLAQPMTLPTNTRLLRLLTLTPPTRLLESLNGNLIQPIILNAKLTPTRPEIAAVADDADVEWVRGVAGTRESVRGFAGCEAVEANELQEEAGVAARCVPVSVSLSVTVVMAVAVAECESTSWRAFP